MLRRRLDDAVVGLMRNEHVDSLPVELRAVEGAVAGFAHLTHRMLEHLAPRHLHVGGALLQHRLAERDGRAAGGPP